MNIVWLGHSGFRLEIGNQVLLIDPWLTGNPMFPAQQRAEALAGATHILVTHGHGDHAAEAVSISRQCNIPIACIHELSDFWNETEGIATVGFGKGGTVALGDVRVTMVNAVHSSSIDFKGLPFLHAGSEAGFMIEGDGHMIYVTGDTAIMADMAWMGEYFRPDIGILCCGGRYTMDMKQAAWAAKKFFDFKLVIPCHYRTFPLLEQSAATLVADLPGVKVVELEVMVGLAV